MGFIRKIFYFSPEIVAGALASAYLALKVLGLTFPLSYFLVLGISVFILYLADHLFDGIRYGEDSPRQSHHFFSRNRKILSLFLGIAVLTDLFLLTRLNLRIILAGSLVALPLLFYYLGIHFRSKRFLDRIPGELFVAILYVAGIWSGPYVVGHANFSLEIWLLIVLFLAAILTNVFLISGFNIETDRQLGIRSLAIRLGPQMIKKWLNAICISGILIYLLIVLLHQQKSILFPATLILLVLLITRLIGFFPGFFTKGERYRYTADSLLLLYFLCVFC